MLDKLKTKDYMWNWLTGFHDEIDWGYHMDRMTEALWDKIQYFTVDEKWGDPFKMDFDLVYSLDKLRRYIGRSIHIHCGYEERDTGGYHPTGRAVDIHIEGMHVIDQFIAASRFEKFNGIGVYGPDVWVNPGLHLDTRPRIHKFDVEARWGCKMTGMAGVDPERIYVPLSKTFFEYLINI